MKRDYKSFQEIAKSMIDLNWELRGDLNVAADKFCCDNAIFDAKAVREAMNLGATIAKRRELIDAANEARRVAGDAPFELWATQGQGGAMQEEFPTLEEALLYVEQHKDDASFAIKLPDGSWYDWETGIESVSYAGPCSVCGEICDLACSDCRIDFQKTIYVCRKKTCRDAHDKVCPASSDEDL